MADTLRLLSAHKGILAGRSLERPVLSEAEIERNVKGIGDILQRLLGGIVPGANAHAGHPAVVLNNLVRHPGVSHGGQEPQVPRKT